jgi:hypothetical protein
MVCRSSKHFSPKHRRFVALPDQPENNDIPVQPPPMGFAASRTPAVTLPDIPQVRILIGLELPARPAPHARFGRWQRLAARGSPGK